MSQSAKKIFRNLLLVAGLAYAILVMAALFGIGSLWGNVQLFRQKVVPDQQIAELAQKISIEFKWQVQDWKNVLLRSTDDTTFQEHWKAFEEDEADVRTLVRSLGELTTNPEERERVALFAKEHQILGEHYRRVAAAFRAEGYDPRKADALIRGADRQPLDILTRIADGAVLRAHVTTERAQESSQTTLLLSLAGFGIGLAGSAIAFFVLVRRNVLDPTKQAFDELDEATERLVQAERMAALGGLVAGIAHEINTPVGVSLTCATTLQETTRDIQRKMADGAIRKQDMTAYLQSAAECSELITANAHRAASLIQSFKQIAVDQTSEARRVFLLKPYIDEVLLSLRPNLKRTAIVVTVFCPDDVRMDTFPGPLSQVLTNLIMNAMTHAFDEGQPGAITIDVQPKGDGITMAFRDNGRGIPTEHLDKVFDPFFTTRRGSGGTGLGLNIVYNIVTLTLGGDIRLRSTLGSGSEFTVNLPCTAPKAA
ncbi:MAG: HAMP domain-containing histidine kinase [Rhodoferax sp.]|nr:HAMP domain-containing histidine kinase [Rhodoferax sp.]